MSRSLRIALVSLSAALVLATPGSALGFTSTVTVDSATFISKSQLYITGTVQCTTNGGVGPVTYEIRLSADQGKGDRVHGNGGTGKMACDTDGVQTWSAYAINSGENFRGGRVTVTADALVCTPGDAEPCPASEPVTAELKLAR
jgi:hypothetical protein